MKRIDLLSTTAALFFFISASGQDWKANLDSARKYDAQKNADRSIEFYVKAKSDLMKDSFATTSYAHVCDEIGHLYSRKRQFKEASGFYLESKQIKEKVLGKADPDYAGSCHSLANCYLQTGQYKLAEPLYLEARHIRAKTTGVNHPDYAGTCNNLAVTYKEMGELEKAEQLYKEVKQIRENLTGREHPDYAVACNSLAVVYILMGKYVKAESLLLEAKKIQEMVSGKDNAYYATICNSLGGLYLSMGLLDKAELLFIRGREIRGKILGKDHPSYAQSCNNLAIVYLNMAFYEKAEPLYLEAKQTLFKTLGKEHPEYASACNNLASFYDKMGQLDKVEPLYAEAKQIREKRLGKDHPVYAESCNNLAIAYRNIGAYDKSEVLYLEAKQILEKVFGKEHPDYANAVFNLASLYYQTYDYVRAEPLYIEAKGIRERELGNENSEYAASCDALGNLYMKTLEYSKAGPFFQEAKRVRAKALGRQHPEYGRSCRNLAEFYRATDQADLADRELRLSHDVNVTNQEAIFQFTNEKEKSAFLNNILGEDEKAYSFYLSENSKSGQPYTLSLFHRNLILTSSHALNKELFYTKDVDLKRKYLEWVEIKKYLASLYSKPIGDRKDDIPAIEDSAGRIEKDLNRATSTNKGQQRNQLNTWETVKGNLNTGESAIEFTSFTYHDGNRYTDSVYYIALLLRKDRENPEMVYLFERRELDSIVGEKKIISGQHRINSLYSKDPNSSRKSLYDLIWKPLEGRLVGINTIYFAPAGLLHKVSFAALPIDDKVQLSDKYRLVQVNTTASLGVKSIGNITTNDEIMLYGGVQYDLDSSAMKHAALRYSGDANSRALPEDLDRNGATAFPYLSGSEREIEGIGVQAQKGKFKVSIIRGNTASEESIKNLSGNNSPGILHIATHGFFFSDPAGKRKDANAGGATVFRLSDNPLIRSGLAMSGANNAWMGKPVTGVEDGILTAYEVSNMYLPNTRLAVLSACETGLGDIRGSEGVYGLQRAFKMAGVENLVMSLWKVPDSETSEFMQAFYKNIFAKQTIQEAFYNAQTLMRKKYSRDPYKWAAWVLIK